MKTMNLVQVDYKEVEKDCRNVRPIKFNTCFHSIDEIPVHWRGQHRSRPSEAPYSYERWLSLILRTRNLDQREVQTIKLTSTQAKLLIAASGSSIITGVPNRAYQEDIEDEILPQLSALQFPPQGLFMRLDGCSPKDGRQTVPGRLSLHSPNDIIVRLTTYVTTNPENSRKVASNIWNSFQKIHQYIMEDLDLGNRMDQLLLEQGYSFDAFYDEREESSSLVELNVFGARSGCGSCLFHWIDDLNKLITFKVKTPRFEARFLIGILDS
ncbi:hypothetical protein FSHL1_005669 [Fusarium sambucinum]